MIIAAFFIVLFHAYIKTRYLIKKNLGYLLLYAGIFLVIVGFIFTECSLPLCLMVLGSFITSGGIGLIVRSIKNTAIKDFLTGLYTRTYFYNEWLPKEIKRQKREKGQITFMIMDLDNFKTINDNYGHKFGDKILKKVAKVLIDSIRSTDIAVRYGGDELLLAFPGVSKKEAKKILKRITENLKKIEVADSLVLTVSTGMSIWSPGEEIEKSIEEADSKMYKIKNFKKIFEFSEEQRNN